MLSNNSSRESDFFSPFLASSAFFLLIETLFASSIVSNAINLSPALGVSLSPVISTGVDGPASTIFSPLSFFIVLTLPYVVPTTTGSPKRSVPLRIKNEAIPPTFLSSFSSITAPKAYLDGFALSSLTSAIASIVSRSLSTPSPVLAEIFING